MDEDDDVDDLDAYIHLKNENKDYLRLMELIFLLGDVVQSLK